MFWSISKVNVHFFLLVFCLPFFFGLEGCIDDIGLAAFLWLSFFSLLLDDFLQFLSKIKSVSYLSTAKFSTADCYSTSFVSAAGCYCCWAGVDYYPAFLAGFFFFFFLSPPSTKPNSFNVYSNSAKSFFFFFAFSCFACYCVFWEAGSYATGWAYSCCACSY